MHVIKHLWKNLPLPYLEELFFWNVMFFLGLKNIFFVISSKYLFILIGRICYSGFFRWICSKILFFKHFLFYANCFSKMVLPVRNATFLWTFFSEKDIIHVNSSGVFKYYRLEIIYVMQWLLCFFIFFVEYGRIYFENVWSKHLWKNLPLTYFEEGHFFECYTFPEVVNIFFSHK